MAFQFLPFVITPEQLENILGSFYLFVGDTHVPLNYTYTPVKEFIEQYSGFYELLCSGKRIDFRNNYALMKNYFITTDMSSVMFGKEHEYNGALYKMYMGTSRGYAPYIAPFSFSARIEYERVVVSTRESYLTERSDVMGFQLTFPKNANDLESFEDFTLFKKLLYKITIPFMFKFESIEKKTNIRISEEALNKIESFHCIRNRNIKILNNAEKSD